MTKSLRFKTKIKITPFMNLAPGSRSLGPIPNARLKKPKGG